MVPISNNQKVPEQDLVVAVSDGQYADTDLILCAPSDTPDIPTAMLQAQYVKYGPVVYQYNTPEELGAAIFALDPSSTHDAVALYKEQVARDKARNEGTLEPSNPVPAPDAAVPADPPATDPSDPPADSVTPPPPVSSESTTTPEVLGVATTTDSGGNATTTVPFNDPTVFGESLVAPPPDLSITTSTPVTLDAATSTETISTSP
jgi:hypothetical protein